MPSDKFNSRSRFNKSTRRNRRFVRTSQSVARVNTLPVRPPSPPTAEEQMLHEGFPFKSCQASHDSVEMYAGEINLIFIRDSQNAQHCLYVFKLMLLEKLTTFVFYVLP
ncbi:17320_t:CDS:2 [Cetraspora pellucida]|uniref:17320_t:CDS:1 n=1 Tax=Cetraspora pellucida TaxID=1433469 RepID=A0A9N9GX51_9GLOM|nr:17320_t:CDS:2 [Cetraspora pellucida]